MAFPYNARLEAIEVEEEVTYATDPTPTATESIRTVGRVWEALSPEFAFPNKREDVLSNNLHKIAPGLPKGRIMSLEFTVQMIGAGAAYSSSTPVRPDTDALFRACGLSRTHVDTGSSESVSYALADSSHSSCTIWAYAAGDLLKIVGCRGDFTWEIVAGVLSQVTFRMMGMLSTAPAETAVRAGTYDAVIPPPAVSCGLAIVPSGGASWTPRIQRCSLTPGNTIVRHDDANAADGIASFEISARAPRFTMSALKPDLSDYTYWARALAQTAHTIDMTVGSTQYNRADIDVDAAYLMSDPASSIYEGHTAGELEFELLDMIVRFD